MNDVWRDEIFEVYRGLEPVHVWRHFAALNAIPRPSGEESAAREYCRTVAEAAGAECQVDSGGNLLVRVPARENGETRGNGISGKQETIGVQAHLDMVCEKRPDIQHDFVAEPIRPRREGERIFATGTTLGADNGIGVALMLALLDTPGLTHGPLELIFTVEEETGLYGAMSLDTSLLQSKKLINLDSEDPDELTVGCAGGAGTTLNLPVESENVSAEAVALQIHVSGLNGGHSGVQIHETLANAIKLLAETLGKLADADIDYRLVEIQGGSAHNAIPRDAQAAITLPASSVEVAQLVIGNVQETLRDRWGSAEANLVLEGREVEKPEAALTAQSTRAAFELLQALPHGVLKLSEAFPGKVETSSNLATVAGSIDGIEIATSSRSFAAVELDKTQAEIQRIATEFGATSTVRDGYPGWEPNPYSTLLQATKEVFERVNGRLPLVEVVHAGLECGVIVSKNPGMEAISFGPLIRGAHSPDEYVDSSTVTASWSLLTALLAQLGEKKVD